MAKPVKETPILFGEEARQFEVKMLRPKTASRQTGGEDPSFGGGGVRAHGRAERL